MSGCFRTTWVGLVGFKFTLRCGEVKTLEAMTICLGLENIFEILHLNLLVESNCLEVINLLNNTLDDIAKVSYYIKEAKTWCCVLGVISFSHVRRCQNILAHSLVSKALEEHESSFLPTSYPEWFSMLVPRDVIF